MIYSEIVTFHKMGNLSAFADAAGRTYGSYSYIATLQGERKWLANPVARKDRANDWVLVLRAV